MCDIEKKSLQEFTELRKPQLKVSDAISFLKRRYGLKKDNAESIGEVVGEKFEVLKGNERDEFIENIMPLLGEESKNQIWEYNHNQITWAITVLIKETYRMPTKVELAQKTGLSRQTIHKHLKEYSLHPLYQNYQEQFRFMADKVLARMFDFAINGDVKAARLFFDILGKNTGLAQNSFVQNNFVQINNIKLSQDKIMLLSPEKLNKIESIIRDEIKEDNELPEKQILK